MSDASLASQFARISRRRTAILVAGLVALLVSVALDLLAGPAELGLADIARGLVDPAGMEPRFRVILWSVRLPDALIALGVGAALGLAGIEIQTVLNNPLASPYTLGIASAATFGAALTIVLAPALPWLPGAAVLPVMALAFALGAGGVVLLVTSALGGVRETVVLFGIAMLFLCDAATALLMYLADAEAVQQIVFWTIGSLTKAGWLELGLVSLVFALVFPFSLRNVWALTLLRGGEEHARAIGVDVARLRRRAILRVSVLTAFAVCFVGSIGFVGLLGPHMARLVIGEDHRFLVPASALGGALLLSVASWLSKSLLPGVVIPVGILTAMAGVPFFLLLIMLGRRAAR